MQLSGTDAKKLNDGVEIEYESLPEKDKIVIDDLVTSLAYDANAQGLGIQSALIILRAIGRVLNDCEEQR